MGRNTVTGRQRSFAPGDVALGFTLIELLIVVTLIVILAGIGLATYGTSVQRAKEATLKEDLFQMNEAIDQYHADKGSYPQDIASLVSGGYLRKVPTDPFTNSADTWVTEMSEPDPSNPSETPGVSGVKSGAPGTGLDGTNFSDW
jgi:general secretion pathway protein G